MDFEKIRTYMKALSELPAGSISTRYQLVIYSDGSGTLEGKNNDKTYFTFTSDEDIEDKFKEYLKGLL